MKYLFTLYLLASLPMSALEERTFHSADRSKSFVGEAVDYNSHSDTVTVRRANGSEVKFKLSLLCEEDQTYVRTNGVVLAASGATRVELEQYKDERQSSRTENTRSSVVPTGFHVIVTNESSELMEDVSAKYTLYYRKGTESGKAPISEKSGTLDLYNIYPKMRSAGMTGTVSLERYSRTKAGGG